MKNYKNLVTWISDRTSHMTKEAAGNLDWFYHLTGGHTHTDFFAIRSTDYSKANEGEDFEDCMVSYKFKKFLVERKRQLTVLERMATRIGYMGAGFLVAAQWTLEPWLYIIGFICVWYRQDQENNGI